MLGICHSKVSTANNGFSLIEMIVVLVLLGLVSGMAVPRLTKLFDSLQTQNQINDIKNTIQGAPLDAYINGHSLNLSEYLQQSAVVPDGWELAFPQPILIKANGICLGGDMRLLILGESVNYKISAPFCRVESV